jgi:predicted amidohydrolase
MDTVSQREGIAGMQDTRITVASLRSQLSVPQENLRAVEAACEAASRDNARLLLLPELMLTGHGAHAKMTENAEPIPTGPLGTAILTLSEKHALCICVGLAELANNIVYNSQMVADRGEYLGLQRKINLSGDEYCHFGAGDAVNVFDIGDVRFGVTICYDNQFPELALIHALNHVDVILCPHAARTGEWPSEMTPGFCAQRIKAQQDAWEKTHRARASDHNVYVVLCNAVGPSTEGLEGVVANHAGTVMGVDPGGEVFLRTSKTEFSDEIVTVELKKDKRKMNHAPSRNRRLNTVIEMLHEKRIACNG